MPGQDPRRATVSRSVSEARLSGCPCWTAQPCPTGVSVRECLVLHPSSSSCLPPFQEINRDFWLCILAWPIRKIQLLGQPLFYRAGYQVCCHVGAFTGVEWNLSSPRRWFNLYSSFKRLQGQYKQISEQNFKWDFKQVAEHRMKQRKRGISRSMDCMWLRRAV